MAGGKLVKAGAKATPAELANRDGARVRAAVANAYAENTKAAYEKVAERWDEFCSDRDLEPMPPAPETIAAYLAELAEAGLSPATLKLHLSAICSAAAAAGHPVNRKHPAIKLALAGIIRESNHIPRKAAPICRLTLERLLATIPTDDVRGVRDRAILALGWHLGMRRSEIVALDWGAIGEGDAVLTVDDTAARIVELRSKTNNTGAADRGVIMRTDAPQALAALDDWLALRGPAPGEPVFVSVGKGGNIQAVARAAEGGKVRKDGKTTGGRTVGGRLAGRDVARLIKDRVEEYAAAVGMSADKAAALVKRVSGHSLRSGIVTELFKAGAIAAEVKQVTGHKSDAVLIGYQRAADAETKSPLRKVGL